jgi:hypothetical protein
MRSLQRWKTSTEIGFGVFIAEARDCFLVITLGSFDEGLHMRKGFCCCEQCSAVQRICHNGSAWYGGEQQSTGCRKEGGMGCSQILDAASPELMYCRFLQLEGRKQMETTVVACIYRRRGDCKLVVMEKHCMPCHAMRDGRYGFNETHDHFLFHPYFRHLSSSCINPHGYNDLTYALISSRSLTIIASHTAT